MSPKYEKVILLGMDGLDPRLLSDLMNKGLMPNFTRLKQMGCYHPLATSNPAQSPVAWASIATGNNAGYHGIYDFLGRRVTDYMPELAITRPNPKNVFGKRETMFLPVMNGNAFWDYTSEKGIPSTILKWPMTFQPKQNGARLFAGLGVPDIKGGLGRYSFFTTKNISEKEEGVEKVTRVKINNGQINTKISGPNIAKLMSKEPAKVDVNITVSDNSKISINIDGKNIALNKGQWSEWIEVKFKLGFMKTVSATVKFYLKEIAPEFELYMTPVQINPKDPVFIISSPDDYVKQLADEVGLYYTLGMPEDTKALEEDRTDEEAFISMCNEIVDEQEKMLEYELNRFKEGLLASAFFSTDRIQHMFWATRDPEHPLYEQTYAERFGHVIDDCYLRMDKILGEVLHHVDEKTAIMVFSDHGFSSFRRAVHINSWLVEKGLMKLKQKPSENDRDGGALFHYVDWSNTRAYSLGFGSIYLNMKGREKNGMLASDADTDSVSEKIISEFRNFKDPKNGNSVVKNVYRSKDIYSGEHVGAAPDLVVGFQDGYRASWQTAIGGSPLTLIEDNLKKWSGDHIIDPSLVPGIFFSNFKINTENPSVLDLAPTVLSCFGGIAEGMQGSSLI